MIVQKQFTVDALLIFDAFNGKSTMATNGLIRESIRATANQVVVEDQNRTWVTVTYDVEEVE